MKFRADITDCENGRDKVLSVCQVAPDGDIEQEVIIQRQPREFDVFDDQPGPKITCKELGLDLELGPKEIRFSGDFMTIVIEGSENIQVDISRLSKKERKELKTVARTIFK